ncbi:energy transducer TonB [Stutzerimonas zhaodongensis]|uniref:Energy transducer TonB n=1 Tax=Stutzerimonas zhaodongensis TaxID=1176257 RepID=A0A3M2HJD5_9GAMM|nr:energy transducer TonB [Stutzerimonas zhaodongensis]MCQ4318488.1 energy transducer TonB [Stutzerimonas zhaodongensis]RMH87489.1 energy transducer TonB [Stutzerimonas zhaodongensis]
MITESRRRAFLDAMQITTWLPRTELPFAAPSRPELLSFDDTDVEPAPVIELEQPEAAPAAPAPKGANSATASPAADAVRAALPRIAMPESRKKAVSDEQAPAVEQKPAVPPPRFALQLLRAGNVVLLVELPTGESFQSRDPAYILLKDLLRAAKLPDKPQQVGDGEPIRWPLLHRGSIDQGAEAARDYVQGVVAAELEEMDCACLWLIGAPALRFAGEVDPDACYRELTVEGLGVALTMPGLEQLMEQPGSKAQLWKAMRRSMPRWVVGLTESASSVHD